MRLKKRKKPRVKKGDIGEGGASSQQDVTRIGEEVSIEGGVNEIQVKIKKKQKRGGKKEGSKKTKKKRINYALDADIKV